MSSSWGEWLEGAKNKTKELAGKAQELAEIASKVAQEKATELAKQANDMRQNYDMELASSILTTINGSSTTNSNIKPKAPTSAQYPRKSVLDLVYVTENLVSMAFPYDPKKPGNAEGGNDINVVSRFLKQRHGSHFMIWNVSEEPYDYSLFGDQVLEYKFPGHPAPPLGLLFKICTSVESWLDADEKNVAVVHCLTGKGRTAALMACILTWIGEFSSPMEGLQYVAQRRSISADYLTIPSQRRYVQYFSNMLDGVKPRSEPLLLRRVIINSIPNFGDENNEGCCPYVQLFKCGKLVATAAPPDGESDGDGKMELKWVKLSEGSISFAMDSAVQGDLLLRCRHADHSGTRVSMFRAAFHTGYVPCGVLRLTKAQLDGACADPRFDEEFFIDLIFAPVEKASRHPTATGSAPSSTPSDSGLVIDLSSSDKYEQSLHRDTRFWDAVSARKTRSKKRRSRKYVSSTNDQFSISDEASAAMNDDEMDSIRFSAVGKADRAAASSSTAGLSGMSDMELIMQLARLEEQGEGDLGDEGIQTDQGEDGKQDSSPLSSTASYANDVAAGGDYIKTRGSGETLPENGGGSGSRPGTGPQTGSGDDELQALADLEKELGLDDLQLYLDSSTSSSMPPGMPIGAQSFRSPDNKTSSKSDFSMGVEPGGSVSSFQTSVSGVKTSTKVEQEEDDDNLDELERYLESLSAPASK